MISKSTAMKNKMRTASRPLAADIATRVVGFPRLFGFGFGHSSSSVSSYIITFSASCIRKILCVRPGPPPFAAIGTNWTFLAFYPAFSWLRWYLPSVCCF